MGGRQGTPGSGGATFTRSGRAGHLRQAREEGGREAGEDHQQWNDRPSLWGLDVQGCQRAFLAGGGWTAWPTCHSSLKALVQQRGMEGDALWAGLGPGSAGGPDPQGGVLRDTQGPPPPLQTAATPLRKATKLCHTWGLPRVGGDRDCAPTCIHRPAGPRCGLRKSAGTCDLATRGRSPARPGTDQRFCDHPRKLA